MCGVNDEELISLNGRRSQTVECASLDDWRRRLANAKAIQGPAPSSTPQCRCPGSSVAVCQAFLDPVICRLRNPGEGALQLGNGTRDCVHVLLADAFALRDVVRHLLEVAVDIL